MEIPHHLFDFLTTDKHVNGFVEALGGLLPEAQGEDYEEQDFANKMKRKKKIKKDKKELLIVQTLKNKPSKNNLIHT